MKKLLHFSASSWCVPCQKSQPIVDEFISENTTIDYQKIEVDDNPSMANDYSVLGVPTFIFFNNGKQVNRHTGMISKLQLKTLFED